MTAGKGYTDIETGGPPTLTRQGSSREGKTTYMGVSSHWYLDETEYYRGPRDDHSRAGFLCKVYGALSAQLALTVLVTWAIAYHESSRQWFLDLGMGGVIVLLLGIVASMVGMFALKDKPGLNVAALTHFVAWMSVDVAWIVSVYYEDGQGDNIMWAFGLTMAVFVGLTAVMLVTRADFTEYRGALGGFLSLMLWYALFCWLFGYQTGHWYAFFGALLFVGFIIVDTSMIVNRYGPEDWIIAVAELYLDIINLFLFVLQLLGGRSRN